MTAPEAKKGEKKMSSSTVEDLTEKLSGISVTPEAKRSPSIPTHRSSGSGFIMKKAQHGLHQPPPPLPLQTDKNSIAKLEENEGSSSGGSLPGEQREAMRLSLVQRKKDFRYMERVNGRMLNILEGLELHTGVFSAAEQKGIVDCVYDLQDKGRRGRLRECTYSEPRKWMRGKGRVTIQFGCCYNYARDKNGNPPGIIRDEEADPIPPFLKNMIKKMVAWEVLPPSCIPNSCIINIYDKDDCIPPHIDHHDFVRPFCTVSFLTECNIVFGTELKVLGPGEFLGSTEIPLPVGSVLVLKGNGADVAKHCVPAVPARRISVTFRKMDESKLPYGYTPDPELQNLQPRQIKPTGSPSLQVRTNASRIRPQTGHGTLPTVRETQLHHRSPSMGVQKGRSEAGETSGSSFQFDGDDFPPLGSSSASSRRLSRPLRQ